MRSLYHRIWILIFIYLNLNTHMLTSLERAVSEQAYISDHRRTTPFTCTILMAGWYLEEVF